MLITFESNAHTDVTMFADLAKSLIKMMGHSGTIPSAIAAKDIPDALDHLKKALDANSPEELAKADSKDDAEPEISASGRAFPLVEMLKAAAKENQAIMWYQKQ